MAIDMSIHMSIRPVFDIFNWSVALGDCHGSER